MKQLILLCFVVTNNNPDPDLSHLPYLGIYNAIYITQINCAMRAAIHFPQSTVWHCLC